MPTKYQIKADENFNDLFRNSTRGLGINSTHHKKRVIKAKKSTFSEMKGFDRKYDMYPLNILILCKESIRA